MKKIKLECFTSNAGVHQFFPISPAKKHTPQWYKDMPQTTKAPQGPKGFIEADVGTIKRCDAFSALYNKGFVIPMWADLVIETTSEGVWQYAYSDVIDNFKGSNLEHHPPEQIGHSFGDYIHLKIVVPWQIHEKTGVDFYFCENTWGMSQHLNAIKVLPGVLNFKNQHNCHINILVKKENNRIVIEHNTPIVYCIPLSKNKLSIKNTLVSDQEYKHLKQLSYVFSFVGTYKNRLKLKL